MPMDIKKLHDFREDSFFHCSIKKDIIEKREREIPNLFRWLLK